MQNWALTIGHWKDVPIRIHVSVPLGLLLFSGFRIVPMWWVSILGLVLIHELGHAMVVRLFHGRVSEVMLTGFGGHCAWAGDVSPLGRAAIACGGVAAQLVVLLVALGLVAIDVVPRSPVASDILDVAIFSNAWIIAFNLVPISPLDGVEAWAFPYLLGKRARARWEARALTEPRQMSGAGAKAQAKSLATQLLESARE